MGGGIKVVLSGIRGVVEEEVVKEDVKFGVGIEVDGVDNVV